MNLLRTPFVALLLGAFFVAGCASPPATSPGSLTLARAAEKKEKDAGELKIRTALALSAPQRARLAQIVQTDDGARALWQEIKAQADGVAAATPDPLKVINYEGRINTDKARIETVQHLQDMDKLAVLGYAYAATSGDEQQRYGKAARDFVLAWSQTFQPTGNPINENKLEPVWQTYAMLREGTLFSVEQKASVESWLRDLGEAELRYARANPHTTHNNWHAKRLKMMAQLGAILNEPKFTDYALDEVKSYVAKSLRGDGTSLDLEERDALSYHVAGLVPFLVLARAAGDKGRELYFYEAPGGASLQKSVNFAVPYAKGEKEYPQWRNTKAAIDHERAKAGIPEYQPGTLYDPREGSTLEMFELASSFEPELLPLVYELSDVPKDTRYPTWNLVLVAAQAPEAPKTD